MSRVDTQRQMALPPYLHHGRASAPSMVDGFRPPRGGVGPSPSLSPGLPRIAAASTSSMTSNRPRSSGEMQGKLVLLQETLVMPSRAVAQSMVTMSNSCPDLTKGRQRSPLVAEGTVNGSEQTVVPPVGLVRCRVPLSMASASSPRLPRRASGYLTARQSTADGTTDNAPTPDALVESTGPTRRRPATQESRLSSTDTPPVGRRRRRAGQFSLTAANDVMAQSRASVAPGSSSSPTQDDHPPLQHRTSTVSRQSRDALPAPLTSRDTPQGAATSRQHNNTTRQNGVNQKKISTASSPESKLRLNKDIPSGNSNNSRQEESLVNKTSGELVHNENTGDQAEEELTNGMAPETYDRCVRWVIDVESAKGKRPLEAIMLPPVQIADS